jgi:hypothetical protein
MITRIEINGFKSFVDFSLDIPPFLVVVGANASGKSNLVDALRVMNGISRGEAFESLYEAGRGTPAEMFHQRENGSRVQHAVFTCDVIADVPGADGAAALRYQAHVVREPDRIERIRPLAARVTMALGEQITGLESRGASSAVIGQLNMTASSVQIPGETALDVSGNVPAALLLRVRYEDLLDTRQRAMWFLARETQSWHFLSLIPARMRDRSLRAHRDSMSAGSGVLGLGLSV